MSTVVFREGLPFVVSAKEVGHRAYVVSVDYMGVTLYSKRIRAASAALAIRKLDNELERG